MYCNKCGKKVPDESNFCLFCGADLTKYREYLDNSENRENLVTDFKEPSLSSSEIKDLNSKNIKSKSQNSSADSNKKPYKYEKAIKNDELLPKEDTVVFKREEFLDPYKELLDKKTNPKDTKENVKLDSNLKSNTYDNYLKYNDINREYSYKDSDIKKTTDSNNIRGYSFFEEDNYSLSEKNLEALNESKVEALPDSEIEALPRPKEKTKYSLKNLFSKNPSKSNIDEELNDNLENNINSNNINDEILESDYDISIYLNKTKPKNIIKSREFILDDKKLDDLVVKDAKINNSNKENVAKRFIKYMFEEEEYDTSYLTTKTEEDKSEVDTDLDEIEEPKIESTLEADEIIPDSNIDKSIDHELFESEDETLKEDASLKSSNRDLTNNNSQESKKSKENISLKDKKFSKKTKTEIIYDSKENKDLNKIDSKKSTNQPSIFKSFKDFMYENEDEDDLLELTPTQYSKLKEEVVSNIEPKTVKHFFFGDNKKRDDDILEDRIFVEEKHNNDDNNNVDIINNESASNEHTDPYKNADKNQNIRFSKKVIDTHQDKNSDSIESEIKKENISKNIEPKDFSNDKSSKSNLDSLEKNDSKKPNEDINIKEIDEKERYLLKDELEKAFKDEIDSGKIVIEVEDNNKKKSPVKNFFSSVSAFFSSKEKDKDLHSENIEIIVNSPIESEDTMPLKLTREEREALNKELNKHNRSKTNNTLNRMHEKVKPLIKRLLEKGSGFIIPMLILALVISIFSLTKGVKTITSAVILGILKVVILYFTLYLATNTSFKSVGIRLKQNVITLFVVIEINFILLLDLIYILISSATSYDLDNLFKAFSPNIVITIISLVLLGIFNMVANYKKLEERGKVIEFLGWFVVLSITFSLIMILIQFLITTLVYSVFPKVVY